MNNKAFYIYGAGIVATTMYKALKEMHHCVPQAFVVTDTTYNVKEIDTIPVMALSEIDGSNRSCFYLIATPEVHHTAIANSLLQSGVAQEQLIFVDNQLENKLLEEYYGNSREFATLTGMLVGTKEDIDKERLSDIAMFQAKSHVDKALMGVWEIPQYIQQIQVGADLTDSKIADLRDNVGNNISGKNRNYCELTATYFAWKNSKAAYKGLCHYRRIFDISDEQLQILVTNHPNVEVILPYPTVFYPDIKMQHTYCINQTDWNAMLQALSEVAPDYYDAFNEVFAEPFFYNYNMLIAKAEVFDDYCSFLFSVLERVEKLTMPKGWERADRFAGYIGENLTTLYFRKNRNKLNIVHAGKVMLI